ELDNSLDRLSIASEDSLNRSNTDDVIKEDEGSIEKWGFRLKDLYRLALRFYKEKEGKAVHLSYEDKLKLVAYTCQVSHGKFNSDTVPALGVLDVIGRDRRLAWQTLGDINQDEAMTGFVELLDKLCPIFKPFVEAHKWDVEERKRIAREEEAARQEEAARLRLEEEERQREEEDRAKQEAQRRQIQEALNQQTYHQFKSYAEQQYPGNPEQQGVLIRQLQEQHYHQYMQQLYQQQCCQQKQEPLSTTEVTMDETARLLSNGGTDALDREIDSEEDGTQASMWTRKDIKEFKESIRKEGGDAIIKVGHGETVTVRVPTHEDGTCLFWEFATDSYDIGFGVYFEWTKSASSQVSVHISESEDEDDEDDDDDDDGMSFRTLRSDDLNCLAIQLKYTVVITKVVDGFCNEFCY
ncbi:hypothetical protein B7P43_G12303, partial [Cryptotermes secundus]